MNTELWSMLKAYSWEELIAAHKFYALTPENKQASILCDLIEHELTIRACKQADETLEREKLRG
jgi:hypothetical protein